MKALVIGAGAQGRVLADILAVQGCYDSIGFVDDDERRWGTQVNGFPVVASLAEVLRGDLRGVGFIVGLGNPRLRLAAAARIEERGLPLLNVIHPSAVILPTASLGHGNMVGATAVINTNARLGNHIIVNTGAVVEHDCVVEDSAAIGPGAHLGARASLARGAFIATGAIVVSRRRVGSESVVGAGAVVTKDLPDHVLAVGIPARVIEHLDENFDWNRVL